MVEQRREQAPPAHGSAPDNPSYYRDLLEDLVRNGDDVVRDVQRLDVSGLQMDIPRLDARFLRLIRHVVIQLKRVRKRGDVQRFLMDNVTCRLFEGEEVRRKGDSRARLPNTPLGIARRSVLTPTTLTIGGLDYRWQTVKMLLRDLHRGLKA
jgi:hypothetical protein